MSTLRVITTSLGGGALTRALLDGSGAAWLAPRPHDPAEWRAHVDALRAAFRDADWHSALAPALTTKGPAADRLARSANGKGIVVTTGQQPGLFGGPLYTWTKALAVLALADALQESTGVAVAPLFWAATDDSDLSEASVTHMAVRGGLETLRLTIDVAEGTSVRDIPLGDAEAPLESLERATGSAVDPRVLDLVREAYAPGRTLGGAYLSLLRALLEPLGISVLDGGHPAVRRAAHPLLTRALERAAEGEASLGARTSEMRAVGLEPQVSPVPALTMVFEYRDGVRRRVPISSAADVAHRADRGALGPNVLLRPIVERALLPTAAYVAGPGEFAYFAQVSAVAESLGAPQPIALPRLSAMVVEPHVERILERYGLTVEELRAEGIAERILARRGMPSALADAIARARQRLMQSVEEIGVTMAGSDFPLSPDVVKGLEITVRHRLDRFERRVLAAQRRRDLQTAEDVATARASLFPLGRAQERVLNFSPMLARHGEPLMGALLERAREHAGFLLGPVGAGTPAPTAR